ncbi:MAG TPA: twin-arginine translocase TatA/TatE family subunit [Candidatus Saccharimonadales bacterium]|nr:twin-arginine translocase TatA/TatE family subunit [Candidatus Saccharimonadales bacterium]
MFGIGTTELIIILVIVLLIFGARKLPELAKSIGQSAREVRKGFNGDDAKTSSKETSKS